MAIYGNLTKSRINNKTVRFSGAPWYEPDISAIIGGIGGIGSWLSFFLSRQEMALVLFDGDRIDEVNLAGQLYCNSDIGRNKAETMVSIISDYCSRYQSYEGIYDEDSYSCSIVFSCFDNMSARKLMFNKWCEYIKDKSNEDPYKIFIDGRMLAEQGEVYFVTPDRIKDYKKTLFDDSETKKEDCSYKATSHCGAIIAGLMTSGFNNYIANIKTGNNMREFPFIISYQLPLMNFKTE